MKSQELVKKLEAGMDSIRDSDKWREWLGIQGRFHAYSYMNTLSIMFHRPGATRVAGFHTWRKLGRGVQMGERGIPILAPQQYKKRDKNGEEPENDEDAEYGLTFRTVYVFDVAQTGGKDLPSPTTDVDGDDAGLFAKLAQVAQDEGLAVDTSEKATAIRGTYNAAGKTIWVAPTDSPAQRAKTLAHELAHHFGSNGKNGHTREESETIAESAAYIVLAHFGLDSGSYSFGYLASWSDTKTLRLRLGEIQKTAKAIIEAAA